MTGAPFDRAGAGPDPPWRTIGELAEDAANLFADTEFLRFPDGAGASHPGGVWNQLWARDLADVPQGERLQQRLARVLGGHEVRPGDHWNHPEDTERAFRGGWYHSGDLGYRDGEGWIHHAGRLKDIIRRGGENISAAEVENVLALHPAVSAVALVGTPDELFGELPKAFVQVKPGHEASTRTAVSLLDHVRGKLARFKVPAYLEFVAGFPMTPSARIRKRELLEPGRDQRTGVFDVAANSWV